MALTGSVAPSIKEYSLIVWDTSRQCPSQARAGHARAPRARGSLEPSVLEHRSVLGSSRLEHDRVIPCAISRDPVGFVYINPAPAFPSSHLPLPISTNTYYSRDLKGSSKSARACESILAARVHSGILKYLGNSSLRAQGCLEPSMPEQKSRLVSSRLVSNTIP